MPFRKRTYMERCWEIIPGSMFWLTLIFALTFSYYHPVWVSLFIILFDLYWLEKAVNSSIHIMGSYFKYRYFVTIDWLDYVKQLKDFNGYLFYFEEQCKKSVTRVARKYCIEETARIKNLIRAGRKGSDYMDYYHLVLLPFATEGFEILDTTLSSLSMVNYPKEKMIVVLASEERVGAKAQEVAKKALEKFGNAFFKFFVTVHPEGLEGEIRGKSANATWAMKTVLPELSKMGIGIDSVLVSNFDSDTIVHPQYFARVTYEFLTAEKPYRSSYQPIAVYNNNIWDSPALIRLVSVNNTFWQFLESSRTNRLRTFSSHTMTLRALVDVGFWRRDLINEDGYVFWQCYLHYQGDYRVKPLFLSISLDTCLADTYKQTLINQYKQKKRWAYNVEYYPTLIPGLLKSKAPFWDRMYKLFQYMEGNYNWASASIIISSLGWLPLILGGAKFNQTVVASNLPFATRLIMTTATTFLIFSVYLNMVLLPPRPAHYSKWKSAAMYAQWMLVPIISVVFGSIPAIESQTRLMLGRYFEFWVTPKTRSAQTNQTIFESSMNYAALKK